jgi:hypothetical protein
MRAAQQPAAMPTETQTIRTYLIGALIICSFSATIVAAEPPRHDALRMRSVPRPNAMPAPSAPTSTLANVAAPPPAPASTAPSAADQSAKQATEVLEQCYAIAHRADASFTGTVTVHATVQSNGVVKLQAEATSLGAGVFPRCVERRFGALAMVDSLPAADASTRVIVLGAAK